MKTFFLSSAAFFTVVIAILQYTARTITPDGQVELSWATDDNPTRQEQMALFRTWYKEKYGEAIGIHIDPSNYDQAKIVVQSVAGSGPDLFDYYGPNTLQSYVDSGILLDVTDEAVQGNFETSRFWPVLASTLSLDGRQYGVPDNAVGTLLLVHEDMLEQLHIPVPKPGWNWQDLITLGQKLTQRDAQGHGTRLGSLGIDWMNLVLQNGGSYFNATGTHCILNSPETVEALQFYSDLQNKYHIVASSAETASMASEGGYGSGSLNIFISGEAGMIDFGRYGYIVINRVNDDRKEEGLPPLRIIPLPPLTGKHTAQIVSSRSTGINRRSKHPKEAVRFLEFLATKTFGDQIDRSFDSLTGVPEYATGPEGLTGGRPFVPGSDDPSWLSGLQQGVPFPSSRFVSGAFLNRVFSEEIDQLRNGLQTPAETAARMEDRINRGIEEYLKVRPELDRQRHELDATSAPK